MVEVDGITLDFYDEARFWRDVAVGLKDECWEWEKHKQESGHGQVRRAGRAFMAHRLAYSFATGLNPEGGVVRHTCDNPACCNPYHLVLGSHADNVADRVSRDRSAKGERNGRAKLTEADVERVFMSCESTQQLADFFNVDRKVIYDIRRRNTWKSVTDRLVAEVVAS